MRNAFNGLREKGARLFGPFTGHLAPPADIARAAAAFLFGFVFLLAPRVLASEASGAAPKLKAALSAAFDEYVKGTQARNDAELERGTNLLWIDGLPQNERAQAYRELKRGEVKMQRLKRLEKGGNCRCT